MKRHPIQIDQLTARVHHLWAEQWLVLTSGDFEKKKFNSMTVGWGSFGTMWSKPFAQVVVRPNRYTHEFMHAYDTFTLCAFPEEYRKSLQTLGSKSGRNCDKIAEAGLTPMRSTRIAAPGFEEAELVVECRLIYRDKINPWGFLDESIDKNYPQKDYHTICYGEIVAVFGTKAYEA